MSPGADQGARGGEPVEVDLEVDRAGLAQYCNNRSDTMADRIYTKQLGEAAESLGRAQQRVRSAVLMDTRRQIDAAEGALAELAAAQAILAKVLGQGG